MSASMEQGNQLLDMAADANDKIRAENKQNFEAWQAKIKQNKEISQGEDWYHGVTDVLGTHGAVAAYYRQGKRASELGVGYAGLARKDISDAGTAIKDAAANPLVTLKSGAQRVGDKVIGVGKSIKGTFFGTAGGEGSSAESDRAGAPQELTPEELDADYQKNVVQGPLESTPLSSGTDDAGYVSNPAEGEGHLAVSQPVKVGQSSEPALTSSQARAPTTETGEDAPASSTTQSTSELKAGEDVAQDADKEGGGLTSKIVSKITGAAEGSLANVGVSKALGNIGGGIDIIKDFEGLGSGAGFFSAGKKDATTGDKVSNALTVGGTVLDIASIALPFLEPVAAAVSVAGAIDGTYQSVKDQEKQQNQDKSNYQKNQVAQKVPPSLAGTGFLASAQTDSHKLIGGSSSF
jgi:hypothetical protein